LLAEAAIIKEAVARGIGVARPLDDERYDLILDLPTGLLRLQRNNQRRLINWAKGL